MQYIGLLDCNNFFVSCERLFRPDLAERPVVVLSSNDGCVVARSQEVKDLGIPMGVPYFQVKDTLKKANTAVFSSQFTLYRDISRRVCSVLNAEVSVMEQYSIDEAFFTYTGTEPAEYAARVKSVVEKKVGIPVSVALAPTKTLAKLANTYAKRGTGVYVLHQDEVQKNAANVQLGELWGVGRGRIEAFKGRGLHTVADILACTPRFLDTNFGVYGTRLQAELAGQVVHQVTPVRPLQKSIMSSRTFKTATTSKAVVEDAIAYHVRQVVTSLKEQGQVARTVRISVRSSRYGMYAFRGGSLEAVLDIPTDNVFTLLQEVMKLLKELWQPGVEYKKAGVMLGRLIPKNQTGTSLFELEKTEQKKQMVDGLLYTMQKRFGTESLQVGKRGAATLWQNARDYSSPAYTTRWNELPVVKSN